MECCKASQFPNDAGTHILANYDKLLMWHFSVGRGSLGRVLLLQVSSNLAPLLLQESSHLVSLLLQESSLHSLSFL